MPASRLTWPIRCASACRRDTSARMSRSIFPSSWRSGSSLLRASSDMRPKVHHTAGSAGVANAARALEVVGPPAVERPERLVRRDDDAIRDRGGLRDLIHDEPELA